jgi:hypothetical protein
MSGLELTIVGVIEAVVTYGLGLAFGAMAYSVLFPSERKSSACHFRCETGD